MVHLLEVIRAKVVSTFQEWSAFKGRGWGGGGEGRTNVLVENKHSESPRATSKRARYLASCHALRIYSQHLSLFVKFERALGNLPCNTQQ